VGAFAGEPASSRRFDRNFKNRRGAPPPLPPLPLPPSPSNANAPQPPAWTWRAPSPSFPLSRSLALSLSRSLALSRSRSLLLPTYLSAFSYSLHSWLLAPPFCLLCGQPPALAHRSTAKIHPPPGMSSPAPMDVAAAEVVGAGADVLVTVRFRSPLSDAPWKADSRSSLSASADAAHCPSASVVVLNRHQQHNLGGGGGALRRMQEGRTRSKETGARMQR
jgi:hypothetical protein